MRTAAMSRAAMIRLGGIGVIAGLILTGCADKPTQKAVTPPERPMVTQAQVAALMKNYDTISYNANVKSDAKLIATIEDGSLLARTVGTYHMARLLGDKLPYQRYTSPKPTAYIPPAGAYPRAFFVYLKTSGKTKANRLDVFRRSDAAAPWKKVVIASSEKPLPPIAVGPSGLATAVAPDASGYAVKPIDVAPLLAKALLSAKSPEGAKFATSPLIKKSNKTYMDEQNVVDQQAEVKGQGTRSRSSVPTKDISAIKTKDGGVLVAGGMSIRGVARLTGGSHWTPEKSWQIYRRHPAPYTTERSEFEATWVVQIPVKGLLKLVSYDEANTNFTVS
jgi:hypothetical protein